MTIEIDISSDIDRALGDVADFFQSQVPFAMAGAIVDTAFDTRRRVVGSTWNEAFEVRNKALPGRMFKVTDDAGGVLRGGATGVSRKLKSRGEVEISVGDTLGRDWTHDQADGGTKTPRGGTIAVPVNAEKLRAPTGRIRKPNKPLAITNKRNHFLLKKGGRKVAIMKREGKNTTAVYLFMQSAQIPKRFRFYEDAEDTAVVFFPGHFDNRLAKAIKTSRFYPG